MTCILFDGKTLAGDKRACGGSTFVTVTKIFRIRDCLVGIAGEYSCAAQMLRWFEDGADIKDFPDCRDKENPESGATLMVINQAKTILLYEDSPYPLVVEDTQCAIGCAEEAARVAMACGLSACDAVLMVSRFNPDCGNGVDTLTL